MTVLDSFLYGPSLLDYCQVPKFRMIRADARDARAERGRREGRRAHSHGLTDRSPALHPGSSRCPKHEPGSDPIAAQDPQPIAARGIPLAFSISRLNTLLLRIQ